jgi:hypothetical protein
VLLINQFFKPDAQAIALSAQDLAVLDAYRGLGARSACAADVYLHIRKALGRDPRLPTIYKIIAKLRGRGLLEDIGDVSTSEGGRPRRLYRLTPAANAALKVADRMLTYTADVTCIA